MDLAAFAKEAGAVPSRRVVLIGIDAASWDYLTPLLDAGAFVALRREALADSPTLEAAAARLRRAQADAQLAGAARYPSLNGETSLDTSRRELSADNITEIIRAGIETVHTIADLALGGKHQHRARNARASQFRAHGKPIELGHHHIEQNQVGPFGDRLLQSGGTVGRGHHAVAVGGQRVLKRRAHRPLVFNDQDTGHVGVTANWR